MSRRTRLLLASAAVVLLIAGLARPATAHARLVSTEPSAGAQIQEPPDQVVLRFDEPMELAFGSISVFDGEGDRRDVGGVRYLSGDRTAVAISLGDPRTGGYAVAWKVTSADGHPLEGSFTFRVKSRASTAPELTRSVPAPGAILEEPPRDVELGFGAPIDAARIEIFDRAGEQLGGGEAVLRGTPADRAGLRLARELAPGGYVLAWEVSAGSQTSNGAFTFRIAGEDEGGAVERLVVPLGGSTAVGIANAVARWFTFLSLLLLTGGLVFFLWRRPEGLGERAPRRYLWVLIAFSVLGTLAAVLIQGPYASQSSLRAALSPSSAAEIVSTRFGQAGLARGVVLAGIAALLAFATRSRGGPSPRKSALVAPAAAALGGSAMATVSVGGHAAAGSLVPLALVNDVVHLSAGALWLGGLVPLYWWTLRGATPDAAAIVTRFSRLATWCVAALVATGSFASWRQVGSVNAATTTVYGQLLLAKIALFVVLLALASRSRSCSREFLQVPEGEIPHQRALRRMVLRETVVAVTILAVTALLVGSVPARAAESRPFETELVVAEVGRSVEINVEPPRAGIVDIHIYTFDSTTGAVAAIDAVAGRLSRDGVGTLNVQFEPAGPGHYSAYGFDVPIPGRWVLELDGELGGEEFKVSTAIDFR